MIDSLATLPLERSAVVTRSVANHFVGLYIGVLDVVASTDSDNQSSTDKLPAYLLHNSATDRTRDLCKMIRPCHARLKQAGWTCEQVNQIEENHGKLRRALCSDF